MLTKLYVKAMCAFRKEDGSVATEYGLLVAVIAVLLVAAMAALRGGIEGAFNDAIAALGGGA